VVSSVRRKAEGADIYVDVERMGREGRRGISDRETFLGP
jgi:hypothetical protein